MTQQQYSSVLTLKVHIFLSYTRRKNKDTIGFLICFMANTKHLPLFLFLFLFLLITTPSTSLTTEQSQIATKIINAMISGGSFDDWSEAFLETNDGQILNSTLFLPKTSAEGINATSPLVASYHIVPQRLDFSDISLMKPFSRFPTLLAGYYIFVTNNSASGFTLDGIFISEPEIFVSPSIVIHRIASPINFSRYGDGHI